MRECDGFTHLAPTLKLGVGQHIHTAIWNDGTCEHGKVAVGVCDKDELSYNTLFHLSSCQSLPALCLFRGIPPLDRYRDV